MGVEGWVDGGEGGERVPPTHVHTHAHMHMTSGNSQGFPQWGQPFA